MSEVLAATAGELLESVAAAPGQAAGQSINEWLAEAQFQRIVEESGAAGAGNAPVYKWNVDPAAEEAFSKIVDETSADGAWQAWKEGGGNVSGGGNATPSPTVKASPQTAIKKPAAAGASVGGLLSMSLPTWVAAAAPLLGVAVGVGLYELSPEFWEKVSRTLLPFAYEDSQAMPVVTDEDGNTYIDKAAVEALRDLFESEGIGETGRISGGTLPEGFSLPYSHSEMCEVSNMTPSGFPQDRTGVFLGTTCAEPIVRFSRSGIKSAIAVSSSNKFHFEEKSVVVQYGEEPEYTSHSSEQDPYGSVTKNGRTAYFYRVGIGSARYESGVTLTNDKDYPEVGTVTDEDIIWSSVYGDATEGGYPEGTSKWQGQTVDIDTLPKTTVYTDPEDSTKTRDFIPVALPTQPGQSVDPTTNPDPTVNSDPEKQISPYILPSIPKQQYPDGSDTEDTQDLDKNAPIPMPFPNPQPKPDTEADPSQPSDNKPSKIVDLLPPFDNGVPIPTPGNPSTPGDGSADGGVGGLVSVYNPTYAELQAFSQWLWVTYADATIDKIWNNPFDGIISLHELYATPSTGAKKYIKSGFLVSPVESLTVPNRYTEINCGTAIFPEFYGNYLDYSPYAKALVYLPFIGIMELNVDDIVGHTVNITYHVDSYSGACIALLECAKEGENAVLYQFNGNCSVQCPIAGGSQAAIKAAQLTAGAYQNAYHVAGVAGLVGGIASGAAQVIGGLASMASSPLGTGGIGSIGSGVASVIQGAGQKMSQEAFGNAAAVSQTVSAKSSVQHSGQFGESYGAMGCKKPYVIIKRPVQVRVPNYQVEYGYPAHKYVTVGECEGYIRCRGIHILSARATDAEKQLIEQALMNGVYVT